MVSKDLQGKILFCWDGSPLSEQALGTAVVLTRLLGSELVIFRALLSPRADLMAAPDLSDKDSTESHYLEAKQATARLRASCPEEVKVREEVIDVDSSGEILTNFRELLQNFIAAEILRRMAKPDIGLVVLGCHGTGSDKRTCRGGISLRVLNTASKPVLVVPLLPPPPT